MFDDERETVFRRANRSDAENVFRVLSSAFQLEKDTSKWRHMRSLAYDATESFMVLERQGEIIGSLMISLHWLRVGSSVLLKGDIGEVSVLRELQGRGYGTILMRQCVNYLKENGFHLSRLGGLVRFYSRFGYVAFPRRYYEFLLTEVKAGASTYKPEEVVSVSPSQDKYIRHYHPQKDWQRRNELYDHFNKDRTGSMVEKRGSAPTSGEPDPKSLNFVYDENGTVLGYLFAVEYPEDVTPFEARITVYDVAFDLDKPWAFIALMRHILREALKRNVHRVSARLPFDPLIQELLVEAELPFSLRELQSAVASNMMMIVNLKSLLEAISPELSRRCPQDMTFKEFSVKIKLEGQEAVIKIAPGLVKIVTDDVNPALLTCDQRAFLRWLFGLNSFDEWQVGVRHTLNNEQFLILSQIFRRQGCASGPWG